MKTLGNIIWVVLCFGWLTALITYLLGLLLTITVVGAPIGLGLMEHAKFLIWPFGNAMVNKEDLNIEQSKAWKIYSLIVIIIYFPFGLILVIMSIFQIAALFISIVGIPVALVLAKSLGTTLNPVNKKCVSQAIVDEMARRKAVEAIDSGKY